MASGVAASASPWFHRPVRRGRRGEALALLAVVAAGAALRAWHLATPSVWWDELVQILIAERPLPDLLRAVRLGIPPGTGNAGAMPLDYLLLHLHLAVAPRPQPASLEAWFRFPAFAASCATVATLFFCGRRLFDRTVGLLAALWLALSVAHALYAAEARFYALMSLLTVGNLWTFGVVVTRPTWRTWATYALVNLLYVLTGVFAVFAFAWQYLVFLVLAIARRRPRQVAALLATGAAAAAVPLLWFAGSRLSMPHGRAGADATGALAVAQSALAFFTQGSPALQAGLALGLPAMLVAAARGSRRQLPVAAVLAMSGLALPCIAAVVRWKQYYFHPRHALFLLPLAALATAAGLAVVLRALLGRAVPDRRRRETTVAVAACVLIAAAQLPAIVRFVRDPVPLFAQTKTLHDWKGVMFAIAPRVAALRDGSLVLVAERTSSANAIGWHYLRWWGLAPRVSFWGYAGDWGTLARAVARPDGATPGPAALALRVPVGLTPEFRHLLAIEPAIPRWPPAVGGWALVGFAPFPPEVAGAGWRVTRLSGAHVALPR